MHQLWRKSQMATPAVMVCTVSTKHSLKPSVGITESTKPRCLGERRRNAKPIRCCCFPTDTLIRQITQCVRCNQHLDTKLDRPCCITQNLDVFNITTLISMTLAWSRRISEMRLCVRVCVCVCVCVRARARFCHKTVTVSDIVSELQ